MATDIFSVAVEIISLIIEPTHRGHIEQLDLQDKHAIFVIDGKSDHYRVDLDYKPTVPKAHFKVHFFTNFKGSALQLANLLKAAREADSSLNWEQYGEHLTANANFYINGTTRVDLDPIVDFMLLATEVADALGDKYEPNPS